MINEHTSAQPNTPNSANMPYGYPTSSFNMMNMGPMQNLNEVYSYYPPPSVYPSFSPFDEHNHWASTETSAGVPPPGPMSYHPSIYTPTSLDLSHSPFDYSPHHTYSHYHPTFPQSTFPHPPSPGTSAFDMPWNHQTLPMQPPIPSVNNGLPVNKKSSVYDEYPSTNEGVNDMLAQHMNSVHLGMDDATHQSNNDRPTGRFGVLPSPKEQQYYQSNSSNLSVARPSPVSSSVPSGPKSYASIVSADVNNSASNKSTPSMSNITADYAPVNHSPRTQRSWTNSRYQQSSRDGNFSNWTNNTSSKRQNYSSSTSANRPQESSEASKYNPEDFILNPKGARFFVIKSYSEDDVHRSIKYNIWCSTEHGNKRLDNAFREREGKGPIYLFFSVNASGHFCGMAEMMSPLDYEHQTNVWHMSNKWQGKFEVKWIYVKDVPNQQFRNIRLENNENKPVTNSRDTQEIPYEKGKLMLKTLHMYRHKTSLFDDFQYYESKQAEEVTTNTNDFPPHRRQLASSRTSQPEQEDG